LDYSSLARAGEAPSKIESRFFWTKTTLIQCLNVLSNAGIPLNSGKIRKNRDLSTTELIYVKTGIATTGLGVFISATKHFGSWDRALREAGINPGLIRRGPKFWTKRLIIKCIKTLHKSGIPLNSSQIQREKIKSIECLRSVTKRDTEG
jgi:hypothetical protein